MSRLFQLWTIPVIFSFIPLEQAGSELLAMAPRTGQWANPRAVRRSDDLREANGLIEPHEAAVHRQRIMASRRSTPAPAFLLTASLSLHTPFLANTG